MDKQGRRGHVQDEQGNNLQVGSVGSGDGGGMDGVRTAL